MVDVIHQQSNAGSDSTSHVIPLARLVPFTTLENNIDSFTVLQLLEIRLNYIHEAAHSVYLRHIYNDSVAKKKLEDELFGPDGTVPIEDKVDSALKCVQKLSVAAK